MPILSSPFDLPPGRLLALDLGQVRTGVATCDEAGLLASPLTVLRRQATRGADFAEIGALIARVGAVGVLVGLPLIEDGRADDGLQAGGSQARWVRRYAGRLAASLQAPVAFWDESLSTVEAARMIREAGGRTSLDAAAAAVILGEFLEARRRRETGQTQSS